MYYGTGFTSEETDSDDFLFDDEPKKRKNYFTFQENVVKKTENKLQAAIINGDLKEVEKIIDLELNNVNFKLDSGWTALMHACFHAQKKIVDFLLEKGADPNLHSDSVTPVMVACSNTNASEDIFYDIVKNLIAHNCLLNIGDKYGQTPLMRAVGSGLVTVVQLLLSKNINIEMRDRQGWTALFWASHHNQAKILEILIEKGARVKEVDLQGRTVMDIAESHGYPEIIEMLSNYFEIEDAEIYGEDINELTTWQDYYPGINSDERPKYINEISNLLYGMNCERLRSVIIKNDIDLRSFLLLEDDGMRELGVEMPFERQRLKYGLRAFHTKSWKLNTIAGLHVNKGDNYNVVDCLAILGSHLQQIYILEATVQYVLRDYCRIQNQIKFEPPDSPITRQMQTGVKKILGNINSIRREIKAMKGIHTKISKKNPKPADLIKEKSTKDIAFGYLTEVLVVCSLGVLAYTAKNYVTSFIRK
ncbi:unnamed protein product [Pieris brassicae]|uniref:SAM domain-containing protein n=1 Tax=Pieris brassicae TaxID=7116 RepID=A0A9P0XEN4_PIEBR|nr:unnamed protein product [Pieris brassicae]